MWRSTAGNSLQIPFIKTHGARNDFLLTWKDQAPSAVFDPAAIARTICDRHRGVGADGWILISGDPGPGADGAIELWNSDGSRGEISGNGTRCAAALLVDSGLAQDEVRIATGAGVKRLRLLARDRGRFSFEMNMGVAAIEDLHSTLTPGRECVVLNVGNPQCAVFVEDFEFDWRTLGAQLERHSHFSNRTNVSFVRVLDGHTLEARFYERGAGETMS